MDRASDFGSDKIAFPLIFYRMVITKTTKNHEFKRFKELLKREKPLKAKLKVPPRTCKNFERFSHIKTLLCLADL